MEFNTSTIHEKDSVNQKIDAVRLGMCNAFEANTQWSYELLGEALGCVKSTAWKRINEKTDNLPKLIAVATVMQWDVSSILDGKPEAISQPREVDVKWTGINLKRICEEKHVSPQRLATKLPAFRSGKAVDASTITRMHTSGIRSIEKLFWICHVLHIKPDVLFMNPDRN